LYTVDLTTYSDSGDLGRWQIGGHPERWESQPRMETLDRRWQTLSGEHPHLMDNINQNKTFEV